MMSVVGGGGRPGDRICGAAGARGGVRAPAPARGSPSWATRGRAADSAEPEPQPEQQRESLLSRAVTSAAAARCVRAGPRQASHACRQCVPPDQRPEKFVIFAPFPCVFVCFSCELFSLLLTFWADPPEPVSYVTTAVAARLAELPQAWGEPLAAHAHAHGEQQPTLVDWSASSREFEIEP